MKTKIKVWLIVYVQAVASLIIIFRPKKIIHSVGEILILGDTIFIVAVYWLACWLCVKILEYKEEVNNE